MVRSAPLYNVGITFKGSGKPHISVLQFSRASMSSFVIANLPVLVCWITRIGEYTDRLFSQN